MDEHHANDSGSDKDELLSQPGYVYHRQKPPARSRFVRRTPKLEEPSPRLNTQTVLRNTLVAHIRMFVIVLVSMLILLGLAVYVSNRVWNQRQQALLSGASRIQPAPPRRAERLYSPQAKDSPVRDALIHQTNQAELSSQTIANYHETLPAWSLLPNPWMSMGRFYLMMNRFAEAEATLELAIGDNWRSAELFNDLGVARLQQRDPGRALHLFLMAQEDDPEYAPAYFNMALCHVALGDLPAARGYLAAYLSRRPDDPKALKEKAALDVANGRYLDAQKALAKALAKAPDWAALYYDAAAVEVFLTNQAAAAAHLEKALSLASVITVYRIYQQPVFKNLRLSEEGKELESKMAAKVRASLASPMDPAPIHAPTRPMTSSGER